MALAKQKLPRVRYGKIAGGKVVHKMIPGTSVTKCGVDLQLKGNTFDLIPTGADVCQKCSGTVNFKHKHKGKKPMPKKTPKTTSSTINPKHYDLVIHGHPIEVVDIIEARFAEDAHLSQALKYLLRAGHKTDSTYVKDVGKCVWWCVRALMFNKVTNIELPPGALGKMS